MTVVVTVEVVNESVWQRTTPVLMVVQDSTVVTEVMLEVVEPTQYGPNVHVEVVVVVVVPAVSARAPLGRANINASRTASRSGNRRSRPGLPLPFSMVSLTISETYQWLVRD